MTKSSSKKIRMSRCPKCDHKLTIPKRRKSPAQKAKGRAKSLRKRTSKKVTEALPKQAPGIKSVYYYQIPQ